MSCIMALDISLLSTGFALAVDGQISSSGTIAGKGEGIERLIYNRNTICRQIDLAAPTLIVFEDLAFSRNEAYAKEIAGLTWMIRAELYTDKRRYLLVGPSQLKKFVTGSGAAKKEQIIKEVFKRWGRDCPDNNSADAIGLAYIGMALRGEWTPTMAAQTEVLAALKKVNSWMTPLVESKGGEW